MTVEASCPDGLVVRPYDAARDRSECVALFRSNVPTYFGPNEEVDYCAFLDAPAGRYLVILDAGVVVAAGGYAMDAEGVFALCWGMVDRARHRRGLGRRLLEARLEAIRADPRASAVRLSTSQHTRGFFERAGFVAVQVTADGFAPGIDRVEMCLDLGGKGPANPPNCHRSDMP